MPCIAVGNGKVILPPELVRREWRFRCLPEMRACSKIARLCTAYTRFELASI